MAVLTEIAQAKVNLTLRVLGRRPDGYHELVSVAAFARLGDTLALEPGDNFSLRIEGPFAAALEADPAGTGTSDNLVARACAAARERHTSLRTGAFRLDKQLPVAAGLGGGSADAAATLRLLSRANPDRLSDQDLAEIAGTLGADVSACLTSRAVVMRGRGDMLQELAPFPRLAVVLANPGIPLLTGEVYAALGTSAYDAAAPELAPLSSEAFRDPAALATELAAHANDLEAPARRLAPVVGDVLSVLAAAPGVLLVRMSGSGPTCFAIFADNAQAETAAVEINAAHPNWWVVPTELG